MAAAPFAVQRARVGRLRVAVAPIAGLRSVVALLALEAGQWSEPPGRAGVARLVAQALARGTATRSAEEWASALDDLGAVARVDVGSHIAVLSGQALAADLAPYLRLVADAVLRPAFDPAQIELVRAETIAALDEESKNTRGVADRVWRELAYPPLHPFRSRPLGDADVVRSATAAELVAFHRREILGRGGVLVLAGGVDAAAALDAAHVAFGDWPAAPEPDERAVPETTIAATQRRVEVVPDKTQSDVILGWLGLPRSDPRFVAARVTNMVFAADTFASRAGKVVRDELGLAYYLFSTLGATKGQAPWTVRMGVNPRNVERAIGTTLAELRVVLAGGFPDEDLALAQDKLVGELQVALESPGGIAQMILEAELFGLGPDHFARYPGQLRAVTKEQVVETARSFLPADRYALAIAGPAL
ncbi:MAG: insulinase family protein [Chloroflexota bacterium]|nr:insulinase family protein [Chloroflexota bacterium]MDE3194326.1 insulinase family protein [Chloroflexota bacterium]